MTDTTQTVYQDAEDYCKRQFGRYDQNVVDAYRAGVARESGCKHDLNETGRFGKEWQCLCCGRFAWTGEATPADSCTNCGQPRKHHAEQGDHCPSTQATGFHRGSKWSSDPKAYGLQLTAEQWTELNDIIRQKNERIEELEATLRSRPDEKAGK